MSGAGGGATKGSSSQSPVKLTGAERRLQGIQLQFANEALDAFRNQASFQQLQSGVGTAALGQLGGIQDMLNTLPESERAGFTREFFEQSLAGGRRAGEISDIEMQRIRSGGVATPEQLATIRRASESELASGLGDIGRFAESQREKVGSELAPRLGLHRSDTPILDRGNRIGAAAVDAAGRLVSDVRGRQAQSELNFPLAASQSNVAQQGLGFGRADVLADLNQRAFQNRLNLTGQTGQQGLGLATAFNVPAAQQSLRPTLATETSQSGFNFTLPSSRAIKEILSTPDGAEILEKLASLPVAFWRYIIGDDQHDHVGTFAEDFRDIFGLGDGKTLNMGDLIGMMLVGLQEVAGQVRELREAKEEG